MLVCVRMCMCVHACMLSECIRMQLESKFVYLVHVSVFTFTRACAFAMRRDPCVHSVCIHRCAIGDYNFRLCAPSAPRQICASSVLK